MYTEIHSVDELIAYLSKREELMGVICQGIDLTTCTDILLGYSAEGAVFLGCRLEKEALSHITESGGLLFPRIPDLPYRPYRPSLYSIDELMHGYERGVAHSFHEKSLDATIYNHFSKFRYSNDPLPLIEALAQRLHDLAIDDALDELLRHHSRIVAIMGGHKMLRSDPAYKSVALIARGLTEAGYFVATGGGPGAMEAGNLGAWMAKHHITDLDKAIDILSGETDYHTDQYLDLAAEVREMYPEGCESLAIPTWFYGHEPTNQFASHIAKYFANSIREDVLLAIATSGVIFSPGSAGTIQEIFMDAAQNHYGSFKVVSPMVFFGERFWTLENPVYPLLQQLAASKQYGKLLSISDSPDEIVCFIKAHEPVGYRHNYSN